MTFSSAFRIHEELHLPVPNNLEALVDEAVGSGQNMRWLERYLSDLLFQEYQSSRLATPVQIKEWHDELTFGDPDEVFF